MKIFLTMKYFQNTVAITVVFVCTSKHVCVCMCTCKLVHLFVCICTRPRAGVHVRVQVCDATVHSLFTGTFTRRQTDMYMVDQKLKAVEFQRQ